MERRTDKIIGLNRNVFFLGVTSLFNDFSSEMLFSVLPAFFIVVLKAGAASLGLVEGHFRRLFEFNQDLLRPSFRQIA